MTNFIKWVDRNLWVIPVVVFLITVLALGIWSSQSRTPVLLAAAAVTTRQPVYSSLAGSSSALLGLTLAAVAILAAFGPRSDRTGASARREERLARARTTIVGSLLATCFFLLVLLVTATLAQAVDARHTGNSVITTLIEAAGIASVTGMLLGGAGLALVIAERARQ